MCEGCDAEVGTKPYPKSTIGTVPPQSVPVHRFHWQRTGITHSPPSISSSCRCGDAHEFTGGPSDSLPAFVLIPCIYMQHSMHQAKAKNETTKVNKGKASKGVQFSASSISDRAVPARIYSIWAATRLLLKHVNQSCLYTIQELGAAID